jgi:hypothetical protein
MGITIKLSDCCRGELILAVRYKATSSSPEERDYICRECGSWCDPVLFLQDEEDGTLTDSETLESGLEPAPSHQYD